MIRRAFAAVASAWKRIFNRYEAGQWSTTRSWLPGYVQDARFDADCATRLEIVRKARYFERNSGILNQLADLFEQYTVGPNGLQFVPSSSDEEWNQQAQIWWDEWQRVCDLSSLHSFGTIQSLIARAWFIDGEVFILKTYGQNVSVTPGQPTRRPRIQVIEAHRVETPANLYQSPNIYDGIETDKNGRPTFYWVRNEQTDQYASENQYRQIPADQIIHIFEPSRTGQMRGLPFSYPVLNDLHDLDDLQILEMQAAKDAAAISNVVENTSGEASPAQTIRNRFNASTQDSAGNSVDEPRQQHIKQIIGTRTIFLKRGEKLEQFKSDRPSVATREHWDYVTAKVCIGHGIPKLLVFPTSLQGTVVRGEYDKANIFFRSRSAVLIAAFTRIYEWAMDWASKNDIRVSDRPPDWFSVDVLPPRSVNVDVGRNSAAMLSELDAGATTYRDIYGPLGLNWRKQLRQRFVEENEVNKLAKEFPDVSIDRIRASIGQHLDRMAAENQQRQQEDLLPQNA